MDLFEEFLAAAADVRFESVLDDQGASVLVVVALIQTKALWLLGGRDRSSEREREEGRF
jgi:hypothetical protein